jgi:hypothetical protein
VKPTLFFITLSTLSSCAMLGTKASFGEPNSAVSITRVALTTTRVILPAGVSAQQADSVFVKKLIVKLSAATGWQIQYVGEVEAYLTKGLASMDGQHYQAVVHAELMLKDYGMMQKAHRYNAWTRMQIFGVPGKQYIGESRFNTLMGKSYMVHPELNVAIEDGVNGLVEPWLKKSQK